MPMQCRLILQLRLAVCLDTSMPRKVLRIKLVAWLPHSSRTLPNDFNEIKAFVRHIPMIPMIILHKRCPRSETATLTSNFELLSENTSQHEGVQQSLLSVLFQGTRNINQLFLIELVKPFPSLRFNDKALLGLLSGLQPLSSESFLVLQPTNEGNLQLNNQIGITIVRF